MVTAWPSQENHTAALRSELRSQDHTYITSNYILIFSHSSCRSARLIPSHIALVSWTRKIPDSRILATIDEIRNPVVPLAWTRPYFSVGLFTAHTEGRRDYLSSYFSVKRGLWWGWESKSTEVSLVKVWCKGRRWNDMIPIFWCVLSLISSIGI